MKRAILASVLLGLMASVAWAEPALQIPIQLGETEASIKQKLGEPSNVVNGNTGTYLWFQGSGISVELDPATRTVLNLTLMGEFRSEGWSVYSGTVTNGVDMNRTFDQVVQALGSSYEKDTFDEEIGVTDTGTYYWNFDTYTLSAQFWLEDSTQKDGRTYPKGSLISIEISKK